MADLYINSEKADLEPGTNIAMTYQAFDMGDIANRNSNRSNGFRLPNTAKNDKLLGNAANTNTSNAPYSYLAANLFQDSFDVSPDGRLVLRKAGNYYDGAIYSGNFKWADALRGKSLRDLDLSVYDHPWNVSNIINGQGNEHDLGYVYALVDYGDLEAAAANVYVERHHPCMYVHTIIEQMFTDIGMTVSGDLITDPFYLKLVVPTQAKNLVAPRWALENAFKVKNNGADFQSEGDFPSGSNMRFNTVEVDQQMGWNSSTYVYTVPAGFEGRIRAELDIIPIFTTASSFTFELLVNGSVRDTKVVTNAAGEQFVLTTTIDTFNIGDTTSIRWTGQGTNDGIVVGASSFFESVPTEKLVYDGTVNVEALLPEMPQSNFLKGILQLFGAFIQVEGNAARIETFKDIASDKANALDWSEKVARKQGQRKWYKNKFFKWNKVFGQRNHIKWKEDDTVADGFGDGFFDIPDVNLPGSVDLFNLPFAASEESQIFGSFTGALVPRYTYDGTDWVQTEESEARLLYVESLTTNVNYFDDVGASTADTGPKKIGKFIDNFATGGQSLGVNNNIIQSYYSELIQALTKAEKYNVWMNLTSLDIRELDFFKLIYLNQVGSYFILNKVSNFLEGQLTEVELIKI